MKPLVIGNWKMNHDFVEAIHLTQQLAVILKNRPVGQTEVVVAPPFVDIRSVGSVIESEQMQVALAAQHVNPVESGAHTGEVSVGMLKRLGVQWVLVGHSERRSMYGQTDDIVRETVVAALRQGVRPVLCCGESIDVREAGGHLEFVSAQLHAALDGLKKVESDDFVVAYEPIWAIGSGLTATAEQVAEMMAHVRNVLTEIGFAGVRVLYGGSANTETAGELVSVGRADGFLVGGASLKSDSFSGIIAIVDDCYAG
jgi:triosephosphate isomerase